jgi:amyloid beta (A4) precursor protein-binding family B protein 2 (Fe65-like)
MNTKLRNSSDTYHSAAQSFPTPMEEPKKVLRAQYLGSMQVSQATGMEVLNEAIEHIVTNTPINQWRNVNVAVAPSMISILTPNVSKSKRRSIREICVRRT